MQALGTFQDYLNAAVKLKTAFIKARPGRQEWDQAPPFMRATAAAPESVQRARQANFSTQYDTALTLKEQGNELVNNDPDAALSYYSQAVSVWLWFDRGPDKAAEDVPLVCTADRLSGREREQTHHMLALCFCNAAACLLALNMPADAVYACGKALQYDPYNVKALYRRALAHRALGTTAGLEAAAGDLAAAGALEPANSRVRMVAAALGQELRELRRQERGLYGNMFQRGDLYGEEQQKTAGGGDGASDGQSSMTHRSVRATAPTGGKMGVVAAAPHSLLSGGQDGGDEARGGGGGGAFSDRDVDPEDPLMLDTQVRKAQATRDAQEADQVLRRMRATLAARRTSALAARLQAHRADRAGRFPWWAVPWWAYALIGLHLAYRLVKIWQLPLPGEQGSAGPLQQPAAPLGSHTEL